MNLPCFHLPPDVLTQIPAGVRDFVDREVVHHVGEIATEAFKAGLCCGIGRDYAEIIFDDLTNRETRSDAAIAAGLGLSHAAIGKMVRRCRANLGLPLRVPNARRTTAPTQNSDSIKSKEAA